MAKQGGPKLLKNTRVGLRPNQRTMIGLVPLDKNKDMPKAL